MSENQKLRQIKDFSIEFLDSLLLTSQKLLGFFLGMLLGITPGLIANLILGVPALYLCGTIGGCYGAVKGYKLGDKIGQFSNRRILQGGKASQPRPFARKLGAASALLASAALLSIETSSPSAPVPHGSSTPRTNFNMISDQGKAPKVRAPHQTMIKANIPKASGRKLAA